MKIPPVLSKSTLRPITSPEETHAVRVVLHDVHNGGPYRLACHARTYIFEKNALLGKHVLDIPVSLWMHGVGQTRFAANTSISDDFRTAKGTPYTFQVIPLAESTAAPETKPSIADAALPLLRELLSNMGAPDEVVKAFVCIDNGDVASLQRLLEHIPQPGDEIPEEKAPASAKSSKADILRKAREAKAAKKKAQLQPA